MWLKVSLGDARESTRSWFTSVSEYISFSSSFVNTIIRGTPGGKAGKQGFQGIGFQIYHDNVCLFRLKNVIELTGNIETVRMDEAVARSWIVRWYNGNTAFQGSWLFCTIPVY
ncbi:MAG: hypothetical protein ACLR0U_22685 [Enterocloster clostridioformis]